VATGIGATRGSTPGARACTSRASQVLTVVAAAEWRMTQPKAPRDARMLRAMRTSVPCMVVTSGRWACEAVQAAEIPDGNHQCACTTSGRRARTARSAARAPAAMRPPRAAFAARDPATCSAIVPA
jgi:hypothetical protein